MSNKPFVTPLPSATVILLRDAGEGLETLLLRRNSRLSFHGGAWVFPGGRIDAEDYTTDAPQDTFSAARRAAVREVREEAGLVIVPEDLIPLSHWTTPEGQPQRFATWFFVAATPSGVVQVDGEEIHAHRWMRPALALAAQRAREIELPPPTFVTLQVLSAYRTVNTALVSLADKRPETFVPRLRRVPGGFCSLYQEDVGYADGNVERPGKRHRLWMLESGWRYERSD
jgi:8-oxo-dGTP pyrophosphatase MutT (NUDIX family)